MKFDVKNIIGCLLILTMILCCSTSFYTRFHAAPTYTCMLVLSILFLYFKKKITRTNMLSCVFLAAIVGVTCFIKFDYTQINSVIIFAIKMIVLLIITSNVSKERFQKWFIQIMCVEVIISLICFTLCCLGYQSSLPGFMSSTVDYYFLGISGYNEVYYTPYYTIGWLSTDGFFYRNAGVFSEPGVHAFMLGLAMLFYLNNINLERSKVTLLILLVGLVSTKSTAGYFSLVILGLLYIADKGKIKSIKFQASVLLMLCVFALVIILFGDVFDKVLTQSGSFGTRANDTLGGLMLVSESPILGYGFFAEVATKLERYGIQTMSNGLIGLFISLGIPLTIIYITAFFKGLRRFFGFKNFGCIILCLFFIFNFNVQAIGFYVITLVFFFHWKEDVKLIK